MEGIMPEGRINKITELHHNHHHHQWRHSPESGLGLPCGFRDRYITKWVISPTINLLLVILIQPHQL
jgi:hypothetical protein